MQKFIFLSTVLLSLLLSGTDTRQQMFPVQPENIESTAEGRRLEDSLKAIYRAELYYAAPGTNVDSIRYENWKRNYALKQSLRQGIGDRSLTETFANGLIEATWHERGPVNEAGDMRVVDFDPATEDLYGISTVGHLWKGNLNGQNWTLLNDDIRFEREVIEVVPHGAGRRIFAVYGSGTDNKKIRYSDDQGQNWATGTGFTFYDHWGRGRRLVVLSDNQTLYYLVLTWQGNPWGAVYQLYKSIDNGVTYTKVWNTSTGYSDGDVDLWKPYDSDDMYLVDNREKNYYRITHDFGTTATTFSTAVNYTNQGIDNGTVSLTGRYNANDGVYDLFMNHKSTMKVYRAGYGSQWTYLSTASDDVWVKGWLADPDNDNLYVGSFQLNKSYDGINWEEQYTQWWEYYKNSPLRKDSMHVDIMNLQYFKKSNGTPFILILNHAGVHITYDHFHTTANLGLANLNTVTLYDQTTASDGFLYCGAQDKGNFKYGGNSLANFNMLSTDNMSTGDGMLGVFINNDQSFYAMIQNGGLMCFPNRNTPNYYSMDIPGNHKPGWINPIVATPDPADNKAYVAGGNLNGGNGSYLILANVNLSSGFSWQHTQYNYDFRANSNNGTSVIKAIGVTEADANRIYVATQDATFFYTTNQGASWTKSTTAALPTSLLPWDIKCSKTNPNRVFISGTGFSNTGVYESVNGGATFTALNGGIPAATFFEIALSDDEEYLYAATSNGPYVYVFDQAQWFSLMGATTPILDFNTVDIVAANIVRFGTYGRGVWDFQITALLPVELTEFRAQAKGEDAALITWSTAAESGVNAFTVEYSTNGTDFKPVGVVAARGGGDYDFTHHNLSAGHHYYRLATTEANGTVTYSAMALVRLSGRPAPYQVYPTVLAAGENLTVQPTVAENYLFRLYNMNGALVVQQSADQALALPLQCKPGVYLYQIVSEGRARTSGKLVVQ